MMDSNPKITKDALRYTLKSNSLREGQNFYHWSCFSVGLAYFRNGDLKNAEFKCDESIEHTPLTHPWLPGLNNALLSMIYYKNGKREESENSLKIARECLNNLEGNENGLHDTILIELLIKERELLGSKNSRKESK